MKKINSRMPIIIVTIILLAIIMGCVLYVEFAKGGEGPVSAELNNVSNNTVEEEENDLLNNNMENNSEENNGNETSSEYIPTYDESESDKKEEPAPNIVAKDENSEEQKKAIEIVKKDWGEKDSNVYYQADEPKGKTGEEHTINVIDKKTTKVKRIYEVNIATGKFEKEDIN